MVNEQVNTETVAPTNPPEAPQATVPTTPGGALNTTPTAPAVNSTPEVRIEAAPEPLIKESAPAVDVTKKSYAFVLPSGSTDDDKQAFADILARAKKEGSHVVLRPDVKVVEL